MRALPQGYRVRHGFTLVEIMVAAALSVVIMTIIATAFQTGLEATSHMKSIGGIAGQLRQSDGIMRSDLRAFHLFDVGNGPQRVSSLVPGDPSWGSDPDEYGFFRVAQDAPTSDYQFFTEPGSDGFGLGSARSSNQWMHFTVHLTGAGPDDAFATLAPPGVVNDPSGENMAGLATANGQFIGIWAEVAYYLVKQDGFQTIPDDGSPNPPLQLYSLRRRQRVLANDALTNPVAAGTAADFPELSIDSAGTAVNTPSSIISFSNRLAVTDPANTDPNRWRPGVIPTTPPTAGKRDYRGSDIVLANVISMRIQVLIDGIAEYKDLSILTSPGLVPVAGVYDTAATGNNVRLRAVRITLRIYDPKNRLTRQVSIDQAL